MNPIDVTVRDARREWRHAVNEEVGAMLLGSLSADPMTLDDLRWASLRFMPPQLADELFQALAHNPDRFDQSPVSVPAEVGGPETSTPGNSRHARLVIDLAERRIVASWDLQANPAVIDLASVDNGESQRGYFHLHDEWQLVSLADTPPRTTNAAVASNGDAVNRSMELVVGRELHRRPLRERTPVVRERLYGEPLLRFLVEQAMPDALYRDRWTGVSFGTQELERRDFGELVRLARLRLGRWLRSPSGGEGSETVRDWLLRDCFHIERDLRDRTRQWQETGEMPPGISLDSETAQRMGAGRQEVILYFDMLHRLTLEALFRSTSGRQWAMRESAEPTAVNAAEFQEWMRELRRARDAWLDAPVPEAGQRSRRQLILMERQRTPVIVANSAAQEDCDCPLCVLIASQQPASERWCVNDLFLTGEFPRFWIGGREDFLWRPGTRRNMTTSYDCPFGEEFALAPSHRLGELFSRRPDPRDFVFMGQSPEDDDEWADDWGDDWDDDDLGLEDEEEALADRARADGSGGDEAFDEELLGVPASNGVRRSAAANRRAPDPDGDDAAHETYSWEQELAASLLGSAGATLARSSGPWRGVFFEKPLEKPTQDFLVLRFAACLTELVSDLHRASTPAEVTRLLTRLFQELLDTLAHDRSSLAAMVSRFCESLDDLQLPADDLRAKVVDLQEQLLEMLLLTQD